MLRMQSSSFFFLYLDTRGGSRPCLVASVGPTRAAMPRRGASRARVRARARRGGAMGNCLSRPSACTRRCPAPSSPSPPCSCANLPPLWGGLRPRPEKAKHCLASSLGEVSPFRKNDIVDIYLQYIPHSSKIMSQPFFFNFLAKKAEFGRVTSQSKSLGEY